MPLLKNGILEKNETWHVGLSCQYTHFMSFSSKSEHDTVADQATLILIYPPHFEDFQWNINLESITFMKVKIIVNQGTLYIIAKKNV